MTTFGVDLLHHYIYLFFSLKTGIILYISFYNIFLKRLIYVRERAHAQAGKGAEGEGEEENPQADSLLSAELDMGLDPRTPTS